MALQALAVSPDPDKPAVGVVAETDPNASESDARNAKDDRNENALDAAHVGLEVGAFANRLVGSPRVPTVAAALDDGGYETTGASDAGAFIADGHAVNADDGGGFEGDESAENGGEPIEPNDVIAEGKDLSIGDLVGELWSELF